MKYLVYLILIAGTYCEAKVVHSGGHREFVGSGSSTGSGGYGGSWWPTLPPVPEDIPPPPPLPELHHGPVLPEYYSLPEVKPYHEQYGYHSFSSSSPVPSIPTFGTTELVDSLTREFKSSYGHPHSHHDYSGSSGGYHVKPYWGHHHYHHSGGHRGGRGGNSGRRGGSGDKIGMSGDVVNMGGGHRSSYYTNRRPRIYHPPVKSYYRFPYNYYVTGKSDDAGNDITNVKTDVDVLAFAKGNSVAKAVAVIDVG